MARVHRPGPCGLCGALTTRGTGHGAPRACATCAATRERARLDRKAAYQRTHPRRACEYCTAPTRHREDGVACCAPKHGCAVHRPARQDPLRRRCAQAALVARVPVAAVYARVALKGFSVEAAVAAAAADIEARLPTYQRVARAAEASGICVTTLRARMQRKGLTLDEAVAMGPARRRAA